MDVKQRRRQAGREFKGGPPAGLGGESDQTITCTS